MQLVASIAKMRRCEGKKGRPGLFLPSNIVGYTTLVFCFIAGCATFSLHVTARHPHRNVEAIMTDARLEMVGLWVFLMLLSAAALMYV